MNNKLNFLNKGISTPVGILIILFCAVAAGGVLIWRLGQEPKEKIEITKDKTAGWHTYQNEEIGFFIKYPINWKTPEEILLSTSIRVSFDHGIFVARGFYYDQIKGRNSTTEELIRPEEEKVNFQKEEIILDAIRAVKISYIVPKGSVSLIEDKPFPERDTKVIKIFIQREGNKQMYISEEMYTIYCEFYKEEEGVILPIFNQMLSTFRFLE